MRQEHRRGTTANPRSELPRERETVPELRLVVTVEDDGEEAPGSGRLRTEMPRLHARGVAVDQQLWFVGTARTALPTHRHVVEGFCWQQEHVCYVGCCR